MFNLCRRVVSSDCASRILSGWAKSNSSVYKYNPPWLWSSRTMIHTTSTKQFERNNNNNNNNQGLKTMSFVRDILEEEGRLGGGGGGTQDEKVDIVHIKLIKNNTFVTITDSKGNKKATLLSTSGGWPGRSG